MTKAGEIAEGVPKISSDLKRLKGLAERLGGSEVQKDLGNLLGISWVIDTTLDIFKSFDTPSSWVPKNATGIPQILPPCESLLFRIQRESASSIRIRYILVTRGIRKSRINVILAVVSPCSLTNLFILQTGGVKNFCKSDGIDPSKLFSRIEVRVF